MSLIQQALKRKLDEQRGVASPTPPTLEDDVPMVAAPDLTDEVHSMPPESHQMMPLAEVSSAGSPARHDRTSMKLPVILALLGLIAGVVWYVMRDQSGSVPPAAAGKATPAAPVAKAKAAQPVDDTIPSAALASVRDRVTKMKDAVLAANADTQRVLDMVEKSAANRAATNSVTPPPAAPVQSPAAVPTPAPVPVPATTPVVATPAPAPVAPVAPAPAVAIVKPPVEWPVFRITSIVKGRGGTMAMIDGNIVGEGESLGAGVVLAEIRENGVVLQRGDEKKYFSIGRTAKP